MKTTYLALSVLILTAPMALAQMNHSTMDHSNMPMNDEKIEGAVHASAVVNSIGDGTVNVSHDPIPEIGWPAMTMDMTVMPDAEMMGDIAAGDTVTLMLIKGDDGMYAIGAIMSE
jgi:Cu(I)/Ag(I) efflux system protein CusF